MAFDGLLAKDSIRMKNKEGVLDKLKKLVAGGPQSLQVITDFDHTISKSTTSDGKTGVLTHGVLVKQMSEKYKSQLQALHEKYVSIERSPNMTAEEKTPHMIDWWSQAHEVMLQVKFRRENLEDYVRSSNVELRDNAVDFFRASDIAKIPVLVFSGGLGDVIDIVLKQQIGQMPANVHTISNFVEFDNSGTIVGFRDPLIHAYNKNATVIQSDHEFFDQLKSRPNVLLMGDSLGDLTMDVGVVNESIVLKIGFFNQEVTETALNAYLSGFDLVLIGDQTFDIPLAVLKSIIAGKT